MELVPSTQGVNQPSTSGAALAHGEIDEAELYFLISHALAGGPLSHIGDALAREASERGLLPSRYDFAGTRHNLSYNQLAQRNPHIPPAALRGGLAQLLQLTRQQGTTPASRGLTSILDLGVQNVLASQTSVPRPIPPSWTLPPASFRSNGQGLQLSKLAMLRELGMAEGRQGVSLAPAGYARQIKHHRTVRGHQDVAYCVMVDKRGEYIITGSDDKIVKIWSTKTFLLLSVCRGHNQEVSDLSINCDDTLFASCSLDTTIRIWQLRGPGRIGTPVAVLLGHTASLTFVDFSPTLPDWLVSSSFDGTCRLWRVAEDPPPPIVLPVTSSFGSNTAIQRPVDDEMPLGQRLSRHRQQAADGVGNAATAAAAAAGTSAAAPANGPISTSPGRQQQQQAGTSRQHRGRRRGDDDDADWSAGEEEGLEQDDDHHFEEDEEEVEIVGPRQRARASEFYLEELTGEPGQERPYLVICGFSRDGTNIIAGANDCTGYLWNWPAGAGAVQPKQTPSTSAAIEDEQQQAGPSTTNSNKVLEPRWHVVHEVCKLEGHKNDVYLLQFTKEGRHLATGSKDGAVRIWRKRQDKRRKKLPPAWEQVDAVSFTEEEEQVVAGGGHQPPRQPKRKSATPPAIDQIVWSCDDSRLVLSVHDRQFTVRVFEFIDDHLHSRHTLLGHKDPVHVLLAHPQDPGIAVSASYGGEVFIWDTIRGHKLQTFDSKNFRPDGRTWPDPFSFLDGYMYPHGNAFVLSDAAGQFHTFGFGGPPDTILRAPYDQFINTEFDQLMQDAHGNVIVAATQQPPHILTGREQMCDRLGDPYPPPFQAAYRAGKLLSVPAGDAVSLQEGKQPAYLLAAPTLMVAHWRVSTAGGSIRAADAAAQRAQERLIAQDAEEDARRAGRRQQQQQQQRQNQRRQTGGNQHRGRNAAANEEQQDGGMRRVAVLDNSPLASDDSFDINAPENTEYRWQLQQNEYRAAGVRASRHRTEEVVIEYNDEEHEGQDPRAQQRLERELRAERRRQAHQDALMRQRRRRGTRQTNRYAGLNDEDGEVYDIDITSEEEFDHSDVSLEPEDTSESDEDGSDGGHARDRRRQQQRQSQQQQQRRKKRGRGGSNRNTNNNADAQGRPNKRQRAGRSSTAATPRTEECYSWLAGAEFVPGAYIPQCGDRVVYLREGHAALLASTNDKRAPPWQTVPRGRTMRPAEPCIVSDMTYDVPSDGSEKTLARVTLTMDDNTFPLHGEKFTVDIPHPSIGYADFIILRSRFDASVERGWNPGDACWAYWQSEQGGEWWVGSVTTDRREHTHRGVLEDRFGCGGLWERYSIFWTGIATPDGGLIPAVDESAEAMLQSPWELHAPNSTSESVRSEAPQLDEAVKQRAVRAVERAANQERWALFQSAPDWNDQYFSTATRRTEFYNRRVAVPLGLMDLTARLLMGYYRQIEAFEHDVQTIVNNAAEFNGPDSGITADAQAMAAFMKACLVASSENEPDVEQFVTMHDHEEAEDDEEDEEEDQERVRAARQREQEEQRRIRAAARWQGSGRRAAANGNINYADDTEDEDDGSDDGAGPSSRHRVTNNNNNNAPTSAANPQQQQAPLQGLTVRFRASNPALTANRIGSIHDPFRGYRATPVPAAEQQLFQAAAEAEFGVTQNTNHVAPAAGGGDGDDDDAWKPEEEEQQQQQTRRGGGGSRQSTRLQRRQRQQGTATQQQQQQPEERRGRYSLRAPGRHVKLDDGLDSDDLEGLTDDGGEDLAVAAGRKSTRRRRRRSNEEDDSPPPPPPVENHDVENHHNDADQNGYIHQNGDAVHPVVEEQPQQEQQQQRYYSLNGQGVLENGTEPPAAAVRGPHVVTLRMRNSGGSGGGDNGNGTPSPPPAVAEPAAAVVAPPPAAVEKEKVQEQVAEDVEMQEADNVDEDVVVA